MAVPDMQPCLCARWPKRQEHLGITRYRSNGCAELFSLLQEMAELTGKPEMPISCSSDWMRLTQHTQTQYGSAKRSSARGALQESFKRATAWMKPWMFAGRP